MADRHRWVFASRFRRGAFGWRPQPAIQRVGEAVAEIKKVARTDPVLGGDGAVVFLEKVSPALEHVDSSSGAIGAAVNRAVKDLAQIIAAAPADTMTRDQWLARLWKAHELDHIPYIEILGECWGELCGSQACGVGVGGSPGRDGADGVESRRGSARVLSRDLGVPECAVPR
jgi:hypothetical protein